MTTPTEFMLPWELQYREERAHGREASWQRIEGRRPGWVRRLGRRHPGDDSLSD
jgi:hypothetical protein